MKSLDKFASALKYSVALMAVSGIVGFGAVGTASAQDMSADEKAQTEAALEQLRNANLADPSNARVAFARALTAKKLGYTGEAIRVLESITSNNSGMARAELELASLYYQTGDYEKARPLFVSASEAPSASPELKERIDQYVEAIDLRLKTSLTVANLVVGVAWQTNANGGSEEFADLFANAVNSLDEEDDFNAFVSGGLSHIRRIGNWERTTWETTVKGYGSKQFEEDQVDTIYVEATTGVRFAMGGEKNDAFSFKPYVKGAYLFLGEASYNTGMSAGLLTNTKLGDSAVLGLGYEYTLQNYLSSSDRPNADDREGDEHQFTASLGFKMSKETTLTFKGDYFMMEADTDWWTSDAYQAGVRLTHVVGGAPLPGILPMSFTAGATWYMADYDAPNPNLPAPANTITRDGDERWVFDVNAMVPFTDSIGLAAGVSYLTQDSDVALYEYDNLRVSLGVALAF